MRVALVVGGGSGIGAASAVMFAEDGCTVAVADISLGAAVATVKQLTGTGHCAYAADVGSEASIVNLFDNVERDVGPICVLVVAAGTAGLVDGRRPTLRETTAANWEQVMNINARGSFLSVREMLRHREKLPVKDGRIVLLASMAAQVLGANSPPTYVASKGAVLALTRVAAGESAKLGLTCNAVAPGAIDTPMLRSAMPVERDASYFSNTVAGRAGNPIEVASAIRWITSAAASYVNGACIDVNGGLAMR